MASCGRGFHRRRAAGARTAICIPVFGRGWTQSYVDAQPVLRGVRTVVAAQVALCAVKIFAGQLLRYGSVRTCIWGDDVVGRRAVSMLLERVVKRAACAMRAHSCHRIDEQVGAVMSTVHLFPVMFGTVASDNLTDALLLMAMSDGGASIPSMVRSCVVAHPACSAPPLGPGGHPCMHASP